MLRHSLALASALTALGLTGLAGEGSAPASAALATAPAKALHLPWKAAGLTEREAAAHLLNRFAYGPRPGEVDAVVQMGLERWLARQLAGNLPDPAVDRALSRSPIWRMTPEQIAATYPARPVLLAEARRAGVIEGKIGAGKGEAPAAGAPAAGAGREAEPGETRRALERFSEERGYHPERELLAELTAQKLTRAVVSENQLSEVMADFWFNHFNVSATDNQARPHLLTYERDAIRPNALGKLRSLLESTAKHPAMLLYLDNAQSTANPGAPTTLAGEVERRRADLGAPGLGGRLGRRGGFRPGFGMRGELGGRPLPAETAVRPKRAQGLNENYARELLELHTLGVDGGYSQQDVVEVARAFTGWTVVPPRALLGDGMERRRERLERAGGLGFVQQGEFLFRADQHDAGAKTVLGQRLPAGRGIEDGEAVLDLVAAHPATARHLAFQLAARFVADQPPAALVDRLARVFTASGGDVRQVLAAIAESPEFWRRETVGAKIKSPFELAASALRATGAQIDDPRACLEWIRRMGQPLYAYQAPTGFPDRAEAWVNTGSLLHRMNFGLQLAAGRVRGVSLDLAVLDGGREGHEPESREAALKTYAALLLAGRDTQATVERLRPMVADPELARKIDEAAPAQAEAGGGAMASPDTGMERPARRPRVEGERMAAAPLAARRELRRERRVAPADLHPPTPLEQVVGVILGSPDFQRR